MNLSEPQVWSFPVPITYGPGSLRELATFCRNAGMSRPLLVTDRGSRNLQFISDAMQILNESGLSSDVFYDISPNPQDSQILAGKHQFLAGHHDGVVAIGGGSGMDGGKAICLVATNDLDLWRFDFEKPPPDMTNQPAFPPLICVPTTAGTGAETDSTAMITDTDRRMKFCVWHPNLKPAAALLDPDITLSLPAHLTAWTGCDALVHAIEAYCVPVFHPMCDAIALEGIHLVRQWLPTAVNEPDNLQARGGMLAASCLAGVSFLKGLGMVHAISHAIGALYDTHHGLTNAIVLPAVLRFNARSITRKVPRLAESMGLEDKSFGSFHAAICALLNELNIPQNLGEIDVPTSDALAVAERAAQDPAATTNPRHGSVAEIQQIVEHAMTGARSSTA